VCQARDRLELDSKVGLRSMPLDLLRLLAILKGNIGRFVPLGEGGFLVLTSELRNRVECMAAYSEAHDRGFCIHPLAAVWVSHAW
jgi:hypothetical protein